MTEIITVQEVKKLIKQKNLALLSRKKEAIDKAIKHSSKLMREGKFCNNNVPCDPDVLKAVIRAFEKEGFKVEVVANEVTTKTLHKKKHTSLYFSI